MASSPIIVTGAAGFIGHHVVRTLTQRGDTVIGIDNLNDYYDPQLKRDRLADLSDAGDLFNFINCDFADNVGLEAALSSISYDRIVHLGAQAGVRYSLENPRAYIQSNVVGHLNMLELARHKKVSHFVYASSSSVYGQNAKIPFSVEDRADNPVSLYAATKKSDELISESYAYLYRIPMTGLRFFTVYGPWGRPDMAPWLFTEAILTGQPIKVFNNGKMRRDFTYIDDIVAGVIATLDNPPADDGQAKPGGSAAPHTIYNIGNNQSESLGRFIEIIEDACGLKAEKIFMPMQAGDVPATYANIDEINKNIGYQPTTAIEIGIPSFVQWYRSYKRL
jgi:UDP-glucuronate 4-epimerase